MVSLLPPPQVWDSRSSEQDSDCLPPSICRKCPYRLDKHLACLYPGCGLKVAQSHTSPLAIGKSVVGGSGGISHFASLVPLVHRSALPGCINTVIWASPPGQRFHSAAPPPKD